ncbi:MAG: thiamine pyrophosphate-dependent dehydrogenase E1 component subunit alpha, partial [Thermoleophilia bacterium]
MTVSHGATDITLPEFHRRMYGILRFEETLLEMFSQGLLVGTTHTCIGQEANAVGVIAHLDNERDIVVSNHRCHGHFLAFTADRLGLLAEVMGRVDGVSGGRGGSQHLCAPNFYTNGIQGSIVPLTTGMAVAQKRREDGAIATVFIGDGTLGQGAVYECLNIAALWDLPLLIVVEDNHYAQTTPRTLAVAGSVPARAEAFGVASDILDTTDVRA